MCQEMMAPFLIYWNWHVKLRRLSGRFSLASLPDQSAMGTWITAHCCPHNPWHPAFPAKFFCGCLIRKICYKHC